MQQRPYPPRRRPMTRAQYEYLLAKRRKEKMVSLAVLAVIATLIVVAVIMILKPRNDGARESIQATAAPTVATTATPTAAPTEAPAAATSQPSAGGTLSAAIAADGQPSPGEQAPVEAAADSGTAVLTTAALTGPAATTAPAAVPNGQLRSVHFRVTGDIMCTEEQLHMAYNAAGDGTFDFWPQLELIAESLSGADYTIGNLETTIGMYNNKNFSGYPMFNSPEMLVEDLKAAGYDFFTLANNHMLDRYFDGMKNTVNWVENFGLEHVGAYRSPDERNTPKIVDINGIKFGFVAYTHSTNTVENSCDPAAIEYGVPYLYRSDIEADIQRLKDAGAEVIIALPHWGDEYIREPDSNQVKYAQRLAKAGADIILGSHSHMVQPMITVPITDADGTTRNVFAISSLGNFLSTHTMQYTDWGIILDFTVSELPDGSFVVENIGYIPTYCWQHDNTVQIISASKYLDNPPAGMSNESYQRMRECYQEAVATLGAQGVVLTV
ncbi:MAG: CapA family protein [Christensenellales bacterium]|nr:CapA family protein [Christensenellales bacterium]